MHGGFLHICTRFAFRFEHRGRNRLPKLVQTIAPSVPFPAFKSEGEPGRSKYLENIQVPPGNKFNSPLALHWDQWWSHLGSMPSFVRRERGRTFLAECPSPTWTNLACWQNETTLALHWSQGESEGKIICSLGRLVVELHVTVSSSFPTQVSVCLNFTILANYTLWQT